MQRAFGRSAVFASGLLLALVGGCGDDGGGSNGDQADATVNQPADAGGGTPDARPTPDAAPPAPDAMPAALACAGETLPTTIASPPVTISGDVQSASTNGLGPLGVSAHLEALNISDDSLIVATDSVVGSGTNTFSMTDPNDSTTALDAYVKATANGFIDTYLYPPYAIYENFDNALVLMFQNSLLGIAASLAGATQTSGNGVIMLIVADCAQQPVDGATVTISPDVGMIRYGAASGLPSSSQTATDAGTGTAFIFDVPPGEYTIDAERDGVSFREHVVKSFADSGTITIVVP